jgi:hypothetical protein
MFYPKSSYPQLFFTVKKDERRKCTVSCRGGRHFEIQTCKDELDYDSFEAGNNHQNVVKVEKVSRLSGRCHFSYCILLYEKN